MILTQTGHTLSSDDLGEFQDRSAVAVVSNTADEVIGGVTSGKDVFYSANFHRFELTNLPRRIVVNGARMIWTPSTTSGVGGETYEIGLLRRDGLWETVNGFSPTSYPTRGDLPFAQTDNGTYNNPSVWVNDAPGATFVSAVSTGGVQWSVGDGTGIGTPTMTATGFAAHLQACLDQFDESDPIIAVHTFRQYSTSTVHGPNVAMFDHATPAWRPLIEIEWTPGDPSSTFEIVPQVQSPGGTMEVTINGTFLDAWDRDIGAVTTWTSSLAGLLTTGTNLVEQDLIVGAHAMTVVAHASFTVEGQDQTNFDNSPTSEGVFAGGATYSVGDVITMSDGSEVVVDATSAAPGPVTQFTVHMAASTAVGAGDTLTQSSVSPAGGSGFTLTLDTDNVTELTGTTNFTITVFDVPADITDAISASTVPGIVAGSNTSLQLAGGLLSAGAGGGSGQKGIAVIDALP